MRKASDVLFLSLTAAAVPAAAYAFCPLCAVAAGAGLGIARRLGVDDTITGVWLGGLLTVMTVWTIDYLERRGIRFFARAVSVTLLYWLMVIVPLYAGGLIVTPVSLLRGLDKTLLGMFAGAAASYFSGKWYERIKARHGGHAWFPFQKVAMPIAPLLILSVIFRLATGRQ